MRLRLNQAGWVERAQKAASNTTTKTKTMPTTAVSFGSTVNQPSTGDSFRKTYNASTKSENGIGLLNYLSKRNWNTPRRLETLRREFEDDLRTRVVRAADCLLEVTFFFDARGCSLGFAVEVAKVDMGAYVVAHTMSIALAVNVSY